jgi:hypothetical protein
VSALGLLGVYSRPRTMTPAARSTLVALTLALGALCESAPATAQLRLRPMESSAPSTATATARPAAAATTARSAAQPPTTARASAATGAGTLLLTPMRVTARRGSAPEPGEQEAEEPIVIEMFAAPSVTPFPAPFALRPFGPPARPLRLISSYDGDDEDTSAAPRVTVSVAPALSILRDYDGEPAPPTEVRIECIVPTTDRALVLLPMRVTVRTAP